ncbi:cache domain-containing protein [Sinobaca sp. H24]|uniref:cache domain-containing protein n=1 Tax=Sinobaca sp. H24 TaxID=2923376 RepID=UPI0020794A37|nr:cache domain-containing protein [Sinobaca sp. H24]
MSRWRGKSPPKKNDVTFYASDISGADFEDSGAAMEKLNAYISQNSDVLSIYTGSADGDMLMAPENELPDDYDPTVRDWYTLAAASPDEAVVTEPYIDAVTGNLTVTIAKMLEDGSGVAGIDYDLTALMSFADSNTIGEEGYMIITDTTGNYLYNPEQEPGTPLQENVQPAWPMLKKASSITKLTVKTKSWISRQMKPPAGKSAPPCTNMKSPMQLPVF